MRKEVGVKHDVSKTLKQYRRSGTFFESRQIDFHVQ